MSTKTRFEKEAKGNSEMAHLEVWKRVYNGSPHGKSKWLTKTSKESELKVALYSFFGVRGLGTNGLSARVIGELKDSRTRTTTSTRFCLRTTASVRKPASFWREKT